MSLYERKKCVKEEDVKLHFKMSDTVKNIKVDELVSHGYNWIIPCKPDKRPSLVGWSKNRLEITHWSITNSEFFGLACGPENDLVVVDLDKCKKDDPDDVDGVLWYEKMFPNGIDTFTVSTPSGGLHLYFKFEPGLVNRALALVDYPHVKVDVRCPGGYIVSFNSPGYKVIKNVAKIRIPADLSIHLCRKGAKNAVRNSVVKIGNGSSGGTALAVKPSLNQSEISQMANRLCSTAYAWDVETEEDDITLKLTPHTRNCLVVDHVHSEELHSCLFVNYNSVQAFCFSHGCREHMNSVIVRKLIALRKLNQEGGEKPKQFTPQEILWTQIRQHASQNRLQKTDGFIWKPRDGHPYWFEPWLTYKEYLNKLFESSREFNQHPRRFKEMVSYLNDYDNTDFPDVRVSAKHVAFKNGVFDLETLEFYHLHDAINFVPVNTVCRHFFNFDYTDESKRETPYFDQIVKHQLPGMDVYNMLLVMIGRLQFKIGEFDSWGVMPFILGSAQLGKSTIFNIIMKMFGSQSSGVISSTQEQVFGLQGLHNKEVIVAPDIPHKMNNVLDCAVFQSMVTGDEVSVASKHQKATAVKWQTPMIWGGNLIPSYTDVGGGAIRRFCLFKFETDIEKVDGSLESKIITTELGNLFLKCVIAYRMLAACHGSNKFFDFAGDYFRDSGNDVLNAMNPLAAWLDTGADDNRTGSGTSTYPMFVKDHFEPILRVKKEFDAYMRYKCPGVRYSWPLLVSAFKAKGYTTKTVHLCKSCKKNALSGCCEFYSPKNRCKSVLVLNLKIEVSDMI